MDDDLPADFDVIVIGTGMTESIVAAAASRIGKKVLHFDSDDFYGGMWASFNFENFIKITQETVNNNIGLFNIDGRWFLKKKPDVVVENNINGSESESKNSTECPVENAEHSNTKPTENERKNVIEWTQETLKKEYRKFNLDLAPKLLFARGELVELLISSNIARYTEFRCVNRVLTWLNDVLEPVPCSRADVFATKHVTVVEKRMLMKLLSSLMEYDESKSNEFHDIENKTFLEYLKSKKLTSNLVHYVLYAIAGGTETMPCIEGIKKCKIFLTSLGRYGNTPFLWSMYGCGELPQCFCRLCAVFGGVYCLKRPLDSIKITETPSDSSKPVEVNTKGKVLMCEHVVLGVNKVPKEFIKETDDSRGISRAIFITNASILEFEKESLTLLQFPPLEGKKHPVTVIELGPSTCSCPRGLYVLHMTCRQNLTAKEDLQQYAEKLLDFSENDVIVSDTSSKTSHSKKPQILWCVYFNMKDTSVECASTSSRLHICSGPDIELDFDHAVQQGRQIFSTIYKDEEFLPRAPDPDEIVFEGADCEPGPIFEKDLVKNAENEDNNPSSVELNNIEDNVENQE